MRPPHQHPHRVGARLTRGPQGDPACAPDDSKTPRIGSGSGKMHAARVVLAGSGAHRPLPRQGISGDYTLIYEESGKRCGQHKAARALAAPLRCAVTKRAGRESIGRHEKYSGSRYYPEIAPFSPQFVGTTFYSSHTMMEATKWGGLIASSEARIVDSRHASNRLSEKTQSAARGGSKDRKQLTNEIGARRALRPLGTVAGYDRWWIANFVDCGLLGVSLGIVCRPDDRVACVWSSRPRLRGGRARRGEAAQQSSAGEFATACCDVKRV